MSDEVDAEVYLDSGQYIENDNYLSWEIENFYNDKGKAPFNLSMKTSPPVLKLDNGSQVVEVVLTKEFTNDLGSVLADVKRAYFNAPTMRPEMLSPDERSEWTKIVDWLKANPLKLSATIIIVVIILLLALWY